MTRKIASTCVAALFGFALTASAQTPPSAPPADPQAPPSAAAPMPQDHMMAKGKKMTGCVQAGTEAGSFELTNVKGKADSAEKKSVKLAAAPGVDLAAHVGHTVELSGAWAPAAAAAAADAKAFSVTNVKMVSATCSTGTN